MYNTHIHVRHIRLLCLTTGIEEHHTQGVKTHCDVHSVSSTGYKQSQLPTQQNKWICKES